jgi:hypothetical protein
MNKENVYTHICTTEYSVFKKEGKFAVCETHMSLRIIMLSEMNQSHKGKFSNATLFEDLLQVVLTKHIKK